MRRVRGDDNNIWDALEFLLAVRKAWSKVDDRQFPGGVGELMTRVTDLVYGAEEKLTDALFDGSLDWEPSSGMSLLEELHLMYDKREPDEKPERGEEWPDHEETGGDWDY